jgi:hypothetical protein
MAYNIDASTFLECDTITVPPGNEERTALVYNTPPLFVHQRKTWRPVFAQQTQLNRKNPVSEQ